jgi:hypothetical protein
VAALVLTSSTLVIGVGWTGTAPGPANPTVAGTVTTDLALADHVRSISIDAAVDMPEFTTFGDGGFKTSKPGLKGATITIEYNQDYAAANVDATFGAGFLAGTAYYIDVKPTSSARGATNPSYVAKGYVSAYPIAQTVGDRAMVSVTYTVDGTFARLTS